MSTVVLDNVADTTAANISTTQRDSAVWVTAGSCTVAFEGATITSLAVGDFKLITIGAGETLTFTATAAGTTAKIKGVRSQHQ